MSEQRTAWLKLASAFGALVFGAVAVAVVIVLAHRTPGPVASLTPSLPSASAATNGGIKTSDVGFPAPPEHAILFAREDGPFALALALVPGTSQLRLQASVVDQQGKGQ